MRECIANRALVRVVWRLTMSVALAFILSAIASAALANAQQIRQNVLITPCEIPAKVLPSHDGGILEVGFNSQDQENPRHYLRKRDSSMNELWKVALDYYVHELYETENKEIVLFCQDGWLCVFTSGGEKEKSMQLDENVIGVFPIDGGFIAEKIYASGQNTTTELTKLSPDGDVEWSHAYEEYHSLGISTCIATKAGLFAGGTSQRDAADDSIATILRLDRNTGDVVWEQKHPVSGMSTFGQIAVHKGMVVGLGTERDLDGSIDHGWERALVLCASTDGELNWYRQLDLGAGQDEAKALRQYFLAMDDERVSLFGTLLAPVIPNEYAYYVSLNTSGSVEKQLFAPITDEYHVMSGGIFADGLPYLFGETANRDADGRSSGFLMPFAAMTENVPFRMEVY